MATKRTVLKSIECVFR